MAIARVASLFAKEISWHTSVRLPAAMAQLYPSVASATAPLLTMLNAVCACSVPVPLSDIVTGEFDAWPAKEAVVDASPLAWGVNVTVNCTFLPAGMVTGRDSPLTINSELLTVAEETTT